MYCQHWNSIVVMTKQDSLREVDFYWNFQKSRKNVEILKIFEKVDLNISINFVKYYFHLGPFLIGFVA
jgi:hypothetical protein